MPTRAGNVAPGAGLLRQDAHQTGSAIAQPQTLKGKRAVSCTVREVQAVEVTRTAHGVKVLGRRRHRRSYVATVTRSGKAKITFDSSLCSIGPSPPR